MSLEIINSCLRALRSEMDIDECRYQSFGIKSSFYSYMPRPAVWLSKVSHPRLMSVVSHIFSILWFLLLGYVYLFIDFIKLVFIKFFTVAPCTERAKIKAIVIHFSSRTDEILKKNLNLSNYTAVTLPWVKTSVANEVKLMSLATYQDLLISLMLSWVVLLKCTLMTEKPKLVLQCYAAFKYILVFRALNKINPDKILITEHFDRWAYLTDDYAKLKNSNFELVQHGIINVGEVDRPIFPFKFQNKICKMKKIYASDYISVKLFQDHVLSLECGEKLEFEIIKNSIKLTPINKENSSLLIVGHAICEKFHVSLYEILKNIPNLVIYYKPHPTIKPSSFVLNLGWILIEDKMFFPKVDALISYPSTLISEYKEHGIPTFLHSLEEERNVRSVSDDVKLFFLNKNAK